MSNSAHLPPSLTQSPGFTALARLLDDWGALAPDTARTLGGVDAAGEALLQHLAAWFSLDDEPAWALAESLDARRALARGAVWLHRRKGTPRAIRDMIRMLGFGEVEIQEGVPMIVYNGASPYNGTRNYGDPSQWATYKIIMMNSITSDQAALLTLALATVAPARCHLAGIIYTGVPVRYNAAAAYNGGYHYGSY